MLEARVKFYTPETEGIDDHIISVAMMPKIQVATKGRFHEEMGMLSPETAFAMDAAKWHTANIVNVRHDAKINGKR